MESNRVNDIFAKIQAQAIKSMPLSVYSNLIMMHFDLIQNTNLYKILQKLPKGVLHHCHLESNDDKQFYRKYIINDPIVYLNEQMKEFRVGSQQQAIQNKWVSMKILRERFNSEEETSEFVSSITKFTKQEYIRMAEKKANQWEIFETKIVNFLILFSTLHICRSYLVHTFENLLINNYQRLEFRTNLYELNQYDQLSGKFIKKHSQQKFTQIVDECYQKVKCNYPFFSLGMIFNGLKMANSQQTQKIFRRVCQINWSKTIGFDFVQQQDKFGSLESYDIVCSRVLSEFPHLNYKKLYHAGQTVNHMNNNIDIAIKAGTKRIGHGINVIQRLELLKQCKDICFEVCPVSNVLLGYRQDSRIASAPILMSLGIPLTINPDDSGKFGYTASTIDFFSVIISYNWGLKQLRILGENSIKYAVCEDQQKNEMLERFNEKWNEWIEIIDNQE